MRPEIGLKTNIGNLDGMDHQVIGFPEQFMEAGNLEIFPVFPRKIE